MYFEGVWRKSKSEAATGWWNQQFMLLLANSEKVPCTQGELHQASFGLIAADCGPMLQSEGSYHSLSGRRLGDLYQDYTEGCESFGNGEGVCNHQWAGYFYDGIWLIASVLHSYLIDQNRQGVCCLRCACHSWQQNMHHWINEKWFLWVTLVDSELFSSWSRSVDDLGQVHSMEWLYQHLGSKSARKRERIGGFIGKSLDVNHINCRLSIGFWFAICCSTGFGGNHLHHPGAVLKNDFLRRVGIADIDNPKQPFDSQMHVSSWYVTCGKSFLQTSIFAGKLTTNLTQSNPIIDQLRRCNLSNPFKSTTHLLPLPAGYICFCWCFCQKFWNVFGAWQQRLLAHLWSWGA